MSNEIAIGIIGLYTLVYVIVFFIQKAQIDKQKSVTESMKSFMEIFKVDEVKKYVDLKEERMIMSFKKTMEDDEYLKQMTIDIVEKKSDEIRQYYSDEFEEKYFELSKFAFMVATKQEKESMEVFVKEYLPLNKDFILHLIDEHYKSNP